MWAVQYEGYVVQIKEHFQLSESLILCDWSGKPTTMFTITGGKVICRSCGKVVKYNEETDLYQNNSSAHLGDTRSKLHDEGKENYARDFYLNERQRNYRMPKPNANG